MRIMLAFVVTALLLGCQSTQTAARDGQIRNQVVEASCGQCQMSMTEPGCDLAVRIDGAPYFVEGAGIDDFGDAHAADGMCNAVRQARVSGRIEGGRFHATQFDVLPVDGR